MQFSICFFRGVGVVPTHPVGSCIRSTMHFKVQTTERLCADGQMLRTDGPPEQRSRSNTLVCRHLVPSWAVDMCCTMCVSGGRSESWRLRDARSASAAADCMVIDLNTGPTAVCRNGLVPCEIELPVLEIGEMPQTEHCSENGRFQKRLITGQEVVSISPDGTQSRSSVVKPVMYPTCTFVFCLCPWRTLEPGSMVGVSVFLPVSLCLCLSFSTCGPFCPLSRHSRKNKQESFSEDNDCNNCLSVWLLAWNLSVGFADLRQTCSRRTSCDTTRGFHHCRQKPGLAVKLFFVATGVKISSLKWCEKVFSATVQRCNRPPSNLCDLHSEDWPNSVVCVQKLLAPNQQVPSSFEAAVSEAVSSSVGRSHDAPRRPADAGDRCSSPAPSAEACGLISCPRPGPAASRPGVGKRAAP